MVDYTLQMLAASWGILFLLVIIVAAFGHAGLTDGTRYDWVISTTDASQRWDGVQAIHFPARDRWQR
eukprot:SAG31_NODE_4518_length_3166_cov_1.642253_2_plen_67_part_00